MRSGDSSQAKDDHNGTVIDIQRLLDDYWDTDSGGHDFMVLRQS